MTLVSALGSEWNEYGNKTWQSKYKILRSYLLVDLGQYYCWQMWVVSTDLDRRYMTSGSIFFPSWGSSLEYLVFPVIKNNCRSSGAYNVCLYCGLSMNVNTCEMSHRAWDRAYMWVKIKDTFCLCMMFDVVGKDLNTPIGAPWLTRPIYRV